MNCVSCFNALIEIFNWFRTNIWSWIGRTWTSCTAQRCWWLCLCCNKWLCWVFLILVAIVSAIIWLVISVVIVVVCAINMIVCGVCYAICWLGNFGNTAATAICVRGCPVITVTVSGPLPPPSNTGESGLTGTPTPGIPGTGTAPTVPIYEDYKNRRA